MKASATRAGTPAPSLTLPRVRGREGWASVGANPWVIAVLVAFASFMEQLDTTIANVVLPYIAGGLGVSQDEASWVVTTYLVANAVALTASSFLARLLGRKRFFLTCLALFTASSVLCGYAWNLDALLLFRLAQGLGGGGMVPLAQSILADSFPPEKRGQGFALFGVAVVVAPVVGPTLGGWLADNFSWHWCFMINGPIGMVALALIAAILPAPKDVAEQRKRLQEQGGFDLVGFVLVATFLGALEIMLDRGLEDDWFASSFIVEVAAVCALAFLLMIPWEISRRNPMIDLRMMATRQFGACFVVMLASGAILLATTQFVPNLVQQDFDYTATWAGISMSPGGFVMMIMIVVGPLTAKVQPKYLIVVGAVITALSMYDMTNVYGDLDFWFFALADAAQPWIAVRFLADHNRVLRRCSAWPDRPGLCPTQRGEKFRRLDRYFSRLQCAGASRAVPSEPADRPGDPVKRSISGHAAPDDELFRRPRQFAIASQSPSHPMDWKAGAGTGILPGLYGRVLGSDAARARGRAACTGPAQGQARHRCPGGSLMGRTLTQ